MPIANKLNFRTPSGLKIRLNHRYFFCQLTKPDRYYTDEEIINNDTMYNATANIESMFLIPTMLIQVFALFTIIFNLSIPVFCISSVALFLFGCIWRCSKQDFLLSTILLFFATLYKMLWGALYVALIVLVFVLNCTYLIVPYIATRFICFVIELLQNSLISNITRKKYGVSFNDTEICAFRFFHRLSESSLRISDYIKLYISTVSENKETPTDKKVSVSEDEQVSLFDSLSESVTIHTLSTKHGYYKDAIDWNEENENFIKEWIDKDTGCIYAIVDTVNDEVKNITVTKEIFETMHAKYYEKEGRL